MPYTLLQIEKDTSNDAPQMVPVVTRYVALVQKDGEDQPFRVELEHFDTEAEARAQIDAWIAERTAEDVRAAENAAAEQIEANKDSIVDSINSNI